MLPFNFQGDPGLRGVVVSVSALQYPAVAGHVPQPGKLNYEHQYTCLFKPHTHSFFLETIVGT